MLSAMTGDTLDVTSRFPRDETSSPYVCRANDVVFLKLIRNKEDLESDDNAFHPEFTNQVFGETENIYGYTDLKIQLNYCAASLRLFKSISYNSVITSKGQEVAKADDIEASLAEYISHDYTTSQQEFLRDVEQDESFAPMGELIYKYSGSDGASTSSDSCSYCVFRADHTTPGLSTYHERLQTFAIWFIDAASYIDLSDPKWTVFLLFRQERSAGSERYEIVGYSTVYSFYAYPEHTRPRVSQFLILPPFQRHGHGYHLLKSIYEFYGAHAQVKDITAEDPSPGFVQLRDVVELSLCFSLTKGVTPSNRQPWDDTDMEQFQKKLKIGQRQAKKLQEIQTCHSLTPESRKEFRVRIKKRLRNMHTEEFEALKEDTRAQFALLSRAYDELEEYYREVYTRALQMS